MGFNLVDEIQKKSREEWEDLLRTKWTDLRIWIQENAEIACAAALALGVLLVLAFKIVVLVAIVCVLLGFGVWYVALPRESLEKKQMQQGSTDNKISKASINGESHENREH